MKMEGIRYSSTGQRIIANIIDGIVLLPVAILPFYILDFFDPVQTLLYSVLETMIYYSYAIMLHWKYGQTVGKMAIGIQVIDVGESRMKISFRQALLRDSVPFFFDILFILSAIWLLITTKSYSDEYIGIPLTIWFIVEIVTMLTNEKRRAAHDFIAGTVVIEKQKGTPKLPQVFI